LENYRSDCKLSEKILKENIETDFTVRQEFSVSVKGTTQRKILKYFFIKDKKYEVKN
jgi:hypothetical protein